MKRIVPDITSEQMESSREFYTNVLGMEVVMDMGWVVTLVSPDNPKAQITLQQPSPTEMPNPDLSIEVEDVDAVYATALDQGLRIVYPLSDEPWGVRRFFLEDPNGKVINVLSHC